MPRVWVSVKYLLVKNLKGSEFNVPVSETARLGNIFMSSFLKSGRPPPPKNMGVLERK